jgi:hypothetical protein
MARNLVMDLEDAHAAVKYLIRDRDSSYTASFDAVLADSGIATIMTGIRVPRMKRSWNAGSEPAEPNCSTAPSS